MCRWQIRCYHLPVGSTVQPPGERGLEAEVLAEVVNEAMSGGNDGQGSVQACRSVGEALDLAARKPERILVFGSLSFLHEVYKYFDVT